MAQINKPTDYFNTVLYTGNGGSQSITGVGFQPDWLWIKCRNLAQSHNAYDSIRGITKALYTNATAGEDTYAMMSSFDSDGWSMNGSLDLLNGNGNTYVAWNWLAGGTASSNTDGSITSSVSANTTAGFSIVSYTGTGANATVGHGLGVVPKMIIVKRRDGAADWTVYNSNIGNTNFLRLNSTLASTSQATYWNNTSPTSSVFTVGSAGDVNTSSGTHIAYCFAEKKGFSKFGSYTGNGAADGTFVYTGFKPAFVILKNTSSAQDWSMKDNRRPGYNVTDDILYPNGNYAEGSGGDIDIVSNGFKIRTTAANTNGSGNTFIYMAFAEQPLVGTNNIPATAR